jgi:hypothetical protein
MIQWIALIIDDTQPEPDMAAGDCICRTVAIWIGGPRSPWVQIGYCVAGSGRKRGFALNPESIGVLDDLILLVERSGALHEAQQTSSMSFCTSPNTIVQGSAVLAQTGNAKERNKYRCVSFASLSKLHFGPISAPVWSCNS